MTCEYGPGRRRSTLTADQQETSAQQRPPRRPVGPTGRRRWLTGGRSAISGQQGERGDGVRQRPLLPGEPEGVLDRTPRPAPLRPARRTPGTRNTAKAEVGDHLAHRLQPALSASRSAAGRWPPAPRGGDSPAPRARRRRRRSRRRPVGKEIRRGRSQQNDPPADGLACAGAPPSRPRRAAKKMAARRPGNCSRMSALAPRKQPPNTRATVAANLVLDDGASRIPMNRALPAAQSRAHPFGKSNQAALDRGVRSPSDRRAGPGDPGEDGSRDQPRRAARGSAGRNIFRSQVATWPSASSIRQPRFWQCVEPQRVPGLVNGDLGETLARVGRPGGFHSTPKLGDDARRAAESPEAQQPPVGEAPFVVEMSTAVRPRIARPVGRHPPVRKSSSLSAR